MPTPATPPSLSCFEPYARVRTGEVLASLSYALDLTEGQPMGHALRSCILGMKIAEEIGLPQSEQADLYYALLMKDAGCSTNASKMYQILGSDDIRAKRDVKTTDWTKVGWESLQYALSHVKTGAPLLERVRALVEVAKNQKRNARELVQMRCERGAFIARRIGLSEATAQGIQSLDEMWNGAGQPDGLRGRTIPLISRIMNLCQNLDVFYMAQGPAAALEMANRRSGTWFDPNLIRVFNSLAKSEFLWKDVENASQRVLDFEPVEHSLPTDEQSLENICLAFADVIDAKSPFTYRHSAGVAGAAVAIARTMGLEQEDVTDIRRAALLHDIGKLSVPNSILDKPSKLEDSEWKIVKQHPFYTYEILKRNPCFGKLAQMAASHHEKLDGSGYFRGLGAEHLSIPARILVVADIFDALHAKRPYRDSLPAEVVFSMMDKDAPKHLDPECMEALKYSSETAASITEDLLNLTRNIPPEPDPIPSTTGATTL